MLVQRTNIQEQLFKTKHRDRSSDDILEEVYRILSTADVPQERNAQNILRKSPATSNNFDFELLEKKSIYHIDHIKKICIDYRLRFLDTRYFKGKIPHEVISKIKNLEKEHHIELKGFKILAPSKLFKLDDRDDPILFAPIGNDYYYLIHKWGRDLHPLRKLMMWPFKNMLNLVATVVGLSYLVTIFIPNGLFSKSSSSFQFWVMFFFMFKCIASIVIFYGFAKGKNFNTAIWNSRYLKS